MRCTVAHRRSSDLALLWLWHRLAATALICPLAWEAPYATGVALKRQKKKKHVCTYNLSILANYHSALESHHGSLASRWYSLAEGGRGGGG